MPVNDEAMMARAVARAEHSRLLAPPNPWVGCVVVAEDGTSWEGGTRRPGGPHAERVALAAAGERARGATLFTTLEPCTFHGRTGPCAEAVIAAGVARVVIAVLDPDVRVEGRGVEALRAAGIEVTVGPGAASVGRQLAPYLHHPRTGRRYVVLKLAATLDGRTAAPDSTSSWITGPEARADVHRLRAECDAIIVGAGTVRADDPRLTVRDVVASDGEPPRPPIRVVLGSAAPDAAVQPAHEMSGALDDVLAELAGLDVVQVLVEGGAGVAGSFHRAGLVDRYVFYVAPALLGGDDGRPVLAGAGVPTMADAWRGKLDQVVKFGNDVRLDVLPGSPGPDPTTTPEGTRD